MRPVVIVGPQGSGKSQALQKLGAALAKGQLVEEWDGVTPLNAAQVALTHAPIRWQGSMLVLSVEDLSLLMAPVERIRGSRLAERAAERLLFGVVPMYPLDESARLMALARELSGEGR